MFVRAGILAWAVPLVAIAAPPSSSFAPVKAFTEKYCASCHGPDAKIAGIDFSALREAGVATANRDTWEIASAKVQNGTMPPKGMDKPTPPEQAAFVKWIKTTLDRADRSAPRDPGRVTARRLNRAEYNNTVRDLVAVDFHPAADFPPDDSGYGFDNIGDVLSLSPVLMEKYLNAAEQIARRAIPSGKPPKPALERYRAPGKDAKQFEQRHTIVYEGDYDVRTAVAGQGVKGGKPLRLAFEFDGAANDAWDVDTQPDQKRGFEKRFHLKPGEHTMRAVLTAKTQGDPVLFRVDQFEIRGPYNGVPPPPPPSHARIFICGHAAHAHTDACVRTVIGDLARRAFRRPVAAAELAPYVRYFEMARADGDPFEIAMRVPLEAILIAPEFLFRLERDAQPGAAPHKVSDLELASRLSYFLWSSMPDDALLRAAQSGTLHQPQVLAAHVRRMLADARSAALIENFAGQWLELRNLDSIQPDPALFPSFDKNLRADMRTETQLFFEEMMRKDGSILDLIDGRYSFLNERLARHYGISGVTGNNFRRVAVDGTQRSGIFTQASILTVSSYPTRTSPVIRGKYLLENVFNDPPPPPPPNVPSLDAGGSAGKLSLKQQLEEHRANATCASCHSRMDPLGFSLENYDAIGRWRTTDGKFPIEATGALPDGKVVNGPSELKAVLLANQQRFAQAITEKLLTYALGRGLERYDRRTVDDITTQVAARNYRFSALVAGIVNSPPFQMRRGEMHP